MEGVKCVLLDIEGTVCPISFVKDTLFPYALNALPDVLKSKWNADDFKPYRDAFPEAAQASPEALQEHVEDLTKRDVKVAYHKNLQGYLWENGYKTGAYSTPLFADVAPKLKQWKSDGFELAIYSSGSVFAQKLLFGHVKSDDAVAGQKRPRDDEEGGDADGAAAPPPKKRVATRRSTRLKNVPSEDTAPAEDPASHEKASTAKSNGKASSVDDGTARIEDLQYLISDWFDTTNAGLKTEASSYEKISSSLKLSPAQMLFLSDNVKEVDAAIAAGMQSLMVDRPGNVPLSEEDRSRLTIVESLDGIKLARARTNGEVLKSDTSVEVPATSEATEKTESSLRAAQDASHCT